MRRLFVLFIFSALLSLSAQCLAGPVKVEGRQLLVDFDGNGIYEPYIIEGVGYHPAPAGVFSSDEWGTCEYCAIASECLYPDGWNGPEHPFSCSAHPAGGPKHPWGGKPCDTHENSPYPYQNECINLYDRLDVDLDRDFDLLQAMNANTIRTWEKVTPTLLQKANQHGIKVIAGYPLGRLEFDPTGEILYKQDIINDFTNNYLSHLVADQNFSSVLFIAIGNENNIFYYDWGNPQIPPNPPHCYVPAATSTPRTGQMFAWYSLVNELAGIAHTFLKQTNNDRPIAIVNGEIAEINNPSFGTTDSQMNYLDIWGINVYLGASFENFFASYADKSSKPLWISETGVDALYTDDFYDDISGGIYDPQIAHEDQISQAIWMGNQWNEIASHLDISIGVNFFSYSDGYFKGNGRIPDTWGWDSLSRVQNNAGQCFSMSPVKGRMPDSFFNQEWFGIMAIREDENYPNNPDIMTPRQVYYALQGSFNCIDSGRFYSGPENGKSCDGTSACCLSANMKANKGICVSNCQSRKRQYVAPIE